MAVTLEGSIKRYIGLSSDAKPEIGDREVDGEELTRANLPAGSSFLEADTGVVYRWNGSEWIAGNTPEMQKLSAMEGLLSEIRDALANQF